MELAVGIAAAVYKGDFDMVMRDTLKSSMDKYYSSKTDRLAWDHMQTKVVFPAKLQSRTLLNFIL